MPSHLAMPRPVTGGSDADTAIADSCAECDEWNYGDGLQCQVHGEEATQRFMREHGAAFDQ